MSGEEGFKVETLSPMTKDFVHSFASHLKSSSSGSGPLATKLRAKEVEGTRGVEGLAKRGKGAEEKLLNLLTTLLSKCLNRILQYFRKAFYDPGAKPTSLRAKTTILGV